MSAELPWETMRASAQRGAGTAPNQDHVALRVVAGAALVLCAADGHGSPDARRGHLGARWAVEEAMRCVIPFARRVVRLEDDPERWPELAELADRLCDEIRRCLRERARMHEANGPRDAVVGAAPVAGNSSLLGALLSRRLLFCWQSGQGDIALIGEQGSRVPFEADAGPPRRMLLHWQPADALGARRLVLLSTDGLALGLADRSAYRAFAEGLYARMARREAQGVRDGLDDRLRAMAELSGEDTSLVAAYVGP
ncbi:protein phosphatase 2C domain-containing protein [Actinospica sp.]|uniref:protein phosphatase 2C domain-containing protein n=1 Tax=Actinospica sp. TaxID=1872142 RepID=UPI002CB60865|nr:protein phosphatase 2C domain-containing protein [Actinospica sp.]HWG28507.1 protein phosphatase 2C domain-containing protein [Actinospica sp.]